MSRFESRNLKAPGHKQNAHRFPAFCAVILALCIALSNCTRAGDDRRTPKFTQYYNRGEQLYLTHCSNCHQKDGTGLGRLYPPLNKSDYMSRQFNEVLCLMRYGIAGEISVNGLDFNHPMPGIPRLTDLEIAEIATYIYNTWEHDKGIVEVKDVTIILRDCKPTEAP